TANAKPHTANRTQHWCNRSRQLCRGGVLLSLSALLLFFIQSCGRIAEIKDGPERATEAATGETSGETSRIHESLRVVKMYLGIRGRAGWPGGLLSSPFYSLFLN